MAELITDAELLAMGIAVGALNDVPVEDRDQARLAASDVALSYIKKRYALPLVSWGVDLRRAVAHIATYDLLSRRGYNPIVGSDDAIKARQDEAMKWLRDVAKGIAELVDVVDSTPDVDEQGPLVATSGETLWGNFGHDGD